MTEVRIITWNIQVYGKTKANEQVNGVHLAEFITAVVNYYDIDILCLQEVMSFRSKKIVRTLAESLGCNWHCAYYYCRVPYDRESLVTFYRKDRFPCVKYYLPSNDFPNRFSKTNGRKSLITRLKAQDGTEFNIVNYHAPPENAVLGLEALVSSRELYPNFTNLGELNIFCGDMNLARIDYVSDRGQNIPAMNAAFLPSYDSEHSQRRNISSGMVIDVENGIGAGCENLVTPEVRDGTLLINKKYVVYQIYKKPRTSIECRQTGRQIDHVFGSLAGVARSDGGYVIDLIELTEPGQVFSRNMRSFKRQVVNHVTGRHEEAFPNASKVEIENQKGERVYSRFLLYRYAISDHLPVFAKITLGN